MFMFLGFVVLILCLVIGVKRGGIGLAAISAIGLVFFIFVMHLKPGKPPVDVMLTIMAVVVCSAFLQASKGLDVMLKYAEKFLRSNPKYITILAPMTTWFLAVLCGTGHVVYAMFPIIYDIAIKQNIRPERPMAVSSIASQMGVCASPASVAVVSVGGNFRCYFSQLWRDADSGRFHPCYFLRCYHRRFVELESRQRFKQRCGVPSSYR
jgi:anaerobic C4-dicarboxylate transporter DcuB